MTIEEAAKILADMYRKAGKNEKKLNIHLFGIKYAEQIEGMSATDIIAMSGLSASYVTEINTGKRLSKHVQLKP